MLKNKYVLNIIILLVDRCLALFGGFFVSILAANRFGPTIFGYFSYAMSIVGLIGFVYSIGLENVVLKMSSLFKTSIVSSKVFFNATLIKFFSSLFALVLVCIFLFFSDESKIVSVLIVVLSISNFLLFFNTSDYILQGEERFLLLFKYRTFSKVVMIFAQLFSIYYTQDVYHYAICNGLYNVLYCLLLSIHMKNCIKMKLFSKRYCLYLLNRARPFVLSSIAIPIFMQSDIIMISWLLNDPSYTGQYGAVQRLLLPLSMFGTVFSVALFSLIKNSVKSESYESLIKIHSILFYSSILFCTVVSYYSDVIIITAFGEQYDQASFILSVYVWTVMFTLIGPIGTKILLCSDKSNFEFYKTSIAAVLNVLLNFLLIQSFGGIGAAYSSLVSYAIANVFIFFCFPKVKFIFNIYCKSIFWGKL